ncbi:MAG TPA: carboxypeptidase regulatory-like domain-containing protein [Verrucomicrobiae bacterium]|nr:carboxypeptidase regulatory-like domain-containing protein [Verrucomicrobiae bacterium]
MKPVYLLLGFVFALVNAAAAGTISGIVKFSGDKPQRKPITEIAANAFCKEACAGKTNLSERFVFGKNGNDDVLANVLVYVSKGLEGKKFDPPAQPVVLDQVKCAYTPHVVGIMVGQPLEIHNSDATLHNVMAQPTLNKGFNEGMPGVGKITKTFDQPEFSLALRCFMHPWMLGYVHVLEHPFYAVTGSDGSFQIKGLPAGEYEISVLHEYSRFAAEKPAISVKVGQNDTQTIEFAYHLKNN